jgi:hypothetical protein
MAAVPCRYEAAEHDPANHCRKNEPKRRINSHVVSHVVLRRLAWRPCLVKFQPLRKLREL